MRRAITIAVIASAILVAGVTEAADAPATWDGLVEVPSKKLDVVFLQPGADFRGYTKVMLDPTEVAFEKNWRRNYNRSSSSLGSQVSERDVQEAITEGVTAASDLFAEAWMEGGYAVVDTPGPDVLLVRTGVLNIAVNAPDVATSARSRSFAHEAGRATFFVEVRDSTTGALLGRAADGRIVGDTMQVLRTRVSNRADFRREVKRWAELSVRGMDELKSLSPIDL